MLAKFYDCKRDERYVYKLTASDQTNTENVDVQILTPENDVVHPVIRLQTGRLGNHTNYVWLSDLERFYYIRNWTMDNGYVTCNLEVDVLMTYRHDLINSNTKVMVKRNEFKYNTYLPDETLKVNAPTRVKTDYFDKGFDSSKQVFYLALVSGQGAEGGE